MALQRKAAAIDHDLAAFSFARGDPAFDVRLVRGRNHRAVMAIIVGRDADAQLLDRRDQLGLEALCRLVTHRHDHRQRHAALARRTEGSAREIVDDLIEIGIGHHDAVVLGTAHCLHALSGSNAAVVDVVRNIGRADEAHRADGRVIEDRIDHFLVAVDDLADALGQTGFEEQFSKAHRHRRIALGRLDDEGIAGGDGDACHPQRDHAGEVERGDARADADGLAHRIDVDARTCALRVFALQHMRDAAAELDHFEAALNVALRIGDDLAVLGGQQVRQLIEVRFDQPLEFEHHAGAALRIDCGPCRLRGERGLHRAFQRGGIAQRHFGLHRAGVGIEHLALARGRPARTADYEMIDLAHVLHPSFLKYGAGSLHPGSIASKVRKCEGGLQ